MTTTRNKRKIFLLDKTIYEISDKQLPTNGDILRHFHFIRSENPKIKDRDIVCCGFHSDFTLKYAENCLCLVKKITTIYNNSGFQTVRVDRMKKKILRLQHQYQELKSLQKRNSSHEIKKRKNFVENVLPLLFDILPADVMDRIQRDKKRSQEDKTEDMKFIIDQRGPREMFIGSPDKRYISAAQRSLHEREREMNLSSALDNTLDFRYWFNSQYS